MAERFTIMKTTEDTMQGKTLVEMVFFGMRNEKLQNGDLLTKDKAISICNEIAEKIYMYDHFRRVDFDLYLANDADDSRIIIHNISIDHPRYKREKRADVDDINKEMRK